jgi:hypothetical protein
MQSALLLLPRLLLALSLTLAFSCATSQPGMAGSQSVAERFGRALGGTTDGSEKKAGYQWHHLATDKNDASPLRGGPWTPRFQRLFGKAGMHLNDPANRVYLLGHLGPHPERYHEELQRIRDEVCTRGSPLHRLLTGS